MIDHFERNIGVTSKYDERTTFEFLFTSYFVKLVRYAELIVKDIDIAEEIVENTFVKLWENRDTINIQNSQQQYLFKSVQNACLNHLKHIKVENKYKLFLYHHIGLNDMENHDLEFPITHLLIDELQHLIHQAINDLPVQCKKVFELSRYDHNSNEEIAIKLDISINTVKTHIGRALGKLRIVLKDYIVLLFF